jgi:hypothetical protein
VATLSEPTPCSTKPQEQAEAGRETEYMYCCSGGLAGVDVSDVAYHGVGHAHYLHESPHRCDHASQPEGLLFGAAYDTDANGGGWLVSCATLHRGTPSHRPACRTLLGRGERRTPCMPTARSIKHAAHLKLEKQGGSPKVLQRCFAWHILAQAPGLPSAQVHGQAGGCLLAGGRALTTAALGALAPKPGADLVMVSVRRQGGVGSRTCALRRQLGVA